MKGKFYRRGDYLVPATHYDLEQLHSFKDGACVDVGMKSSSGRSLKMHKMYFALLRLAIDYDEPRAGFISKEERNFAVGLSEFVKSMGYDSTPIETAMKMYMEDIIEARRALIPQVAITKDMQVKALHDWVKIECDYCDLVMTPDGLVKKAKSIGFHNMTHEEWMDYYPKAWRVLWHRTLSKAFKSEAELEQAINRLTGFIS